MTKVKSISEIKKEMIIEIPSELIEENINKRLFSIGKKAKIKGFRPGKIPSNVVKQHYGNEARQEALSDLIQKSYSEAIAEKEFRPVGQPLIEPIENKKDNNFLYKAIFETLPAIKLKGLDSIKIEKPSVDITDKDINEMMGKLQKQKRTWSKSDKKSLKGNQVIIDFKGMLDGELIKGGEGKDVPVVLGEGQMLPDFEKGLLGVKANQEKSFVVKFPKDYHSSELAGKKVNFEAVIKSVDSETLPELDDKLAEEFGVTEGGIEKLKADVTANMHREVEQRIAQDIKEQVMNSLLSSNNIEIPDVMHQNEIENMQKESMRQMNITDEDKKPPAENFTEMAAKRVRLGLLLSKIIEEKSITVDTDKVRKHVETMCAGYDNPSEIINQYMSNPQFVTQVEPIVLEEQAIELLAQDAKEKKKKVSFSKYMNN